jgi:hypothetical protein
VRKDFGDLQTIVTYEYTIAGGSNRVRRSGSIYGDAPTPTVGKEIDAVYLPSLPTFSRLVDEEGFL